MIDDAERLRAERRMTTRLRKSPRAVRARYVRSSAKLVVSLDTGVDLVVPANLLQGLSDARADDLSEIEISPTGLGLHWPKLDADLYVPGLLEGQLGSRKWMSQAAAVEPRRAARSRRSGSSTAAE